MWPFKKKPKLYVFRIWYHFSVTTNAVTKFYPDDIYCWAPNEEKALDWFARDNPHVTYTAIICERKI